MKPTSLALSLDWLAYAGARLGWPGLLGIALVLAALALDHFQTQPLEANASQLNARAEQLARQPLPAVVAAPPKPTENLPVGADAPAGVARLFAAAKHAGLRLERGGYRPASTLGAGLKRYQINLPVSGEYPAIRAFLAEALERQPGLALDNLTLLREAIGTPEVTAKLSLTLYLREAP
jgi:hypothetical protein